MPQRLVDVAAADTRLVADAAAAAVREVALVVRPQVVDLGLVGVDGGEDPFPHHLEVSGPPLATSVSVDMSDAWIRVLEAAGGYDVSLAAPVRGAVSGEVVLRGAAGEQRVQVRAEGRPTSLPRPARPPDVAVAPPPRRSR